MDFGVLLAVHLKGPVGKFKIPIILVRGSDSTGAAGAFAPVYFEQGVQCSRPDEELSRKWPLKS